MSASNYPVLNTTKNTPILNRIEKSEQERLHHASQVRFAVKQEERFGGKPAFPIVSVVIWTIFFAMLAGGVYLFMVVL